MRASLWSARAMITSCWRARSSDPMRVSASTSTPNSASTALAERRIASAVDEPPTRRLVVEEQRLGDGEVGHDVDLLGDQDDAVALRIGDVGGPVGRPVDRQLALEVLPEQSGQHADDRRLARPVLAEQGDDLAPAQLERQVGDRPGVPERLADVRPQQVACVSPGVPDCGSGVATRRARQHSGRSSGTLV